MPVPSLLDPANRVRPVAPVRAYDPEDDPLYMVVRAAWEARDHGDGRKRKAIVQTLERRFGVVETGEGFHLPASITGGSPFALVERGAPRGLIERTQQEGAGGPLGGFNLQVGWAQDVVDRARTTVGVWDFLEFLRVNTREYVLPACMETSRASASRYGGISSRWGLSEITLPPASDAPVSATVFRQNRLLIYTQISNDLFTDSAMVGRWLKYVAIAEFRNAIEYAVIQGPTDVGGGIGPQGIVLAPCTVTVSKGGTASSSISTQNVNDLWRALYSGCRERAVWLASPSAIDVLEELSVTTTGTTFPLVKDNGPGQFRTIKGRPLLTSEFCSVVGNPGDLICVDLSQYIMTWLNNHQTGSGLSIAFEPIKDNWHRGVIGMPEGAVDLHWGTENLFSTDQMALKFTYRGDGRFVWPNTMTIPDGTVVGPASIVAQR
jgi:HK97 family phage major capsid protein